VPTFPPVTAPPDYPVVAVVSEPFIPSPVPVDDDVTGDGPSRYQLLVGEINGPDCGELLSAVIESYSTTIDEDGQIQFSAATTDPSIITTLGNAPRVWNGKGLVDLDGLVNLRVHPVRDGKVGPAYILRSEASVSKGRVSLTGQQMGHVFGDRFVGTARRHDYFNGRGFFRTGTQEQLGVTVVGPHPELIDVDLLPAGPDGQRCLRVRGNPSNGYVQITTVVASTSTTGTQRVTVRVGGFVKLPSDAVDDVTVLSVTTKRVGDSLRYWPPYGPGDELAANTTADMGRNQWLDDPLSAGGLLPAPPYTVYVSANFYPQSESGWTYLYGLTAYKRDSLGTGAPKDLVYHLRTLIDDAQHGTDKSSWGLTPVVGALTGTSELGVWRDEEDRPLTDALDALTGRDDGPEWPWIEPDLTVHCAARRGADRDDIEIGPDDILNPEGWSTDPGSQASEVRAVTDRGTDYWREEEVARNTTKTNGQVIERSVRAPNGMGLQALQRWTDGVLARVGQPQETCRPLVRGSLGHRVNVGDRFPVTQIDGHLAQHRVMRCSAKTVIPAGDLVWLDMGADDNG
jgi:hypothetical protein